VREVHLVPDDFVAPVFIRGDAISDSISSMPGIKRFATSKVVDKAKEIFRLGIPAVLLFGVPSSKDKVGSGASRADGVVQQGVKNLKKDIPELTIITDVCLCSYTDHGHCGIISDGKVDNDRTLQSLSKIAISHAEAGADIIAPSAMMDGQVGAIREALDDAGFRDTGIMGYSAKIASALYDPFREATSSSPGFGDRNGYQMDLSNAMEAMREIRLDIKEGADIVMIKPALFYLDLIAKAKSLFDRPIAAFSVGGEYSMIKTMSRQGLLEERKVMFELLYAIKRAGADIIITYFAEEVARILSKEKHNLG